MANELTPPEPDPKPPPRNWDLVFTEAPRGGQLATTPAAPGGGAGRTTAWMRAATPIIVLLIYGAYKFWGGPHREGPMGEPERAATLTGVRPAGEDVRLKGETREFVAKLEALARTDDWRQVRSAAAGTKPEIRKHPVVRAFAAIARARTAPPQKLGDALALERELESLEVLVASEKAEAALTDQLRLARAELILRRAKTAQDMAANADTFRSLLARQKLAPGVLAFRLKLSRAWENHGDVASTSAKGVFHDDRVGMLAARSAYQAALRWLTAADGWSRAQPIGEGARAGVDRLLEKIRSANSSIHGPSLPFTNKNPETWTGKAGDPVHDAPGGAW